MIYKLRNEITIQVNYDWFISLNFCAGGPQKTHQSYHQAPLGKFHETYLLCFLN